MKYQKFTLTEIMAVMTIIVIVLSIGVSGYRNMTSQASLIIESNEVKSRVKKSIDYGRRSHTPMIFSVLMGGSMSAKSFLFGGQSSLTYAFNFDTSEKNVSGDSVWRPNLGINEVEMQLSGSSDDDDFEDACINDEYGMCVNLINRTDYLLFKDTTNNKLSEAPYGFYIECRFKIPQNAQELSSIEATLINTHVVDMKVSEDGKLYCDINGEGQVPAANAGTNNHERVVVDTGKWVKAGFSVVTHMERLYLHLFVNGEVVASYPQGLSAEAGDASEWTYEDYYGDFDNSPIYFGQNLEGYIDDIKVYDCTQGDIFPVDPKAGYLVTAHGRHETLPTKTSEYNENKSVTSVLIDGNGKLVPLNTVNPQDNSWEADMVGFASSSIYGKLQRATQWGQRVWRVQGSRISNLPESGYLLLYHNNHVNNSNYYEIIQYEGFDGTQFIRKRQLCNSDTKTGGRRDYFNIRYLQPIIIDSEGNYK